VIIRLRLVGPLANQTGLMTYQIWASAPCCWCKWEVFRRNTSSLAPRNDFMISRLGPKGKNLTDRILAESPVCCQATLRQYL
jgi:hypothetical protein